MLMSFLFKIQTKQNKPVFFANSEKKLGSLTFFELKKKFAKVGRTFWGLDNRYAEHELAFFGQNF